MPLTETETVSECDLVREKGRSYRTSTSPCLDTMKDPSGCFSDMYHLYSCSLPVASANNPTDIESSGAPVYLIPASLRTRASNDRE